MMKVCGFRLDLVNFEICQIELSRQHLLIISKIEKSKNFSIQTLELINVVPLFS